MIVFPLIVFIIIWSKVFGASKEPTYSELLAELEKMDFENIFGDVVKTVVKPLDSANKAAKAGGSGNAGANVNESFGVGVKGKNDQTNEKGSYDVDAGFEIGKVDDNQVVLASAAAVGANAGKNINESNFFRKGSKTFGYHKILHKDEFKKDKIFYDENEKSGKYDNTGKGIMALIAGAGGKIIKGKIDRNFARGSAGKQGNYEKKSFEKILEGFANAQGFGNMFKNSDGGGN